MATTTSSGVNGLGDVPRLVPVLENLARRHAGYGVREEHYGTVGGALLLTLSQGLGEDFTPAVRKAWTDVYGVVASTMISASTADA